LRLEFKRLISDQLTMLAPFLLLVSALTAEAADTLKGVVDCMNHEECLGTNRECSFEGGHASHRNATGDYEYARPNRRVGKCVCKPGFVQVGTNFACERKRPPMETRATCKKDEDCRLGEICMTWEYDPAADNKRKLRSGLAPVRSERHQLCVDSWVIQQHISDWDEPRTGGGLRSHRRDNFNADEYFFGGRRPPRVHQQYIGFAEDMMLILFLVCILATLVTVHRATCYRQFQEARRNTPLRHLIPIAEDRPPPYSHTRSDDTVDGIPEVVCTGSLPKRVSETPPPSYEEALYRNSVRLPAPQMETQTRAVDVTMEEDSSLPNLVPNTTTTTTTNTTNTNTNNITTATNTTPNGNLNPSPIPPALDPLPSHTQPQASPPTSPTLEPTNPSPLYLAASAEAAVALLPEQLHEEKKEEEQVVEEEQTGSSRTTTIAANSTASVAKDSCTVVLGGSGGPVIPV